MRGNEECCGVADGCLVLSKQRGGLFEHSRGTCQSYVIVTSRDPSCNPSTSSWATSLSMKERIPRMSQLPTTVCCTYMVLQPPAYCSVAASPLGAS
jgi:hypothetical protein